MDTVTFKTCCRMQTQRHICACRVWAPEMFRDCGRCLKVAPWSLCAHWVLQFPDARLLVTRALHADSLVATPMYDEKPPLLPAGARNRGGL